MANSVIYRDLLLKQQHGLPLWKPDPNANLPEAYTKEGISVGDVGLLTDDGGFDYLFNIHAEAHDPVNQFLGTPTSFHHLPLDPATNIHKIELFHPKKTCIMRNVSIMPATDVSLVVESTITKEHAAMLVLPHGANRYQAKAYDEYKTYVIEHGKSWYEYLNQVQQRGARNNSLYLVTGCDKTRSWGLAAGSPHQECTVAGSLALGTSDFHASWVNAGGVES
ncbi:hypothetical protein BYT27DRAFT_7074141 [Phlegmacium glaucopus]|nr:hypothetical protein BYT27DRAFT_7074141 [Phlegmacium glaucopus]